MTNGKRDKANQDLKAILDLLAEWRDEYCAGFVTMTISRNGCGSAYTYDDKETDIDLKLQHYTNREDAEEN